MKKFNRYLFLLILILGASCSNSKDHMTTYYIKLWKDTPGWSFAKAVRDEDSLEMKKILNKGEITVDYRDPKFGQSLLHWAVINNRQKAVRLLLEMGANPNLHNTFSGRSPIVDASDIGVDIEILKLILRYGGNPNDKALEHEQRADEAIFETPLICAVATSFEKTKLLIDYGADVNLIFEHKDWVDSTMWDRETALRSATLWGNVEIVSYLLFEKGADFNESYGVTIKRDTFPYVEFLRNWDLPLDSKEYKIKMRIVEYLKEHGQDYWKTPIPKEIEKRYPKEYLDRY